MTSSRLLAAAVTLALSVLSCRAQQGNYPPGVTEEVHVAIQRGLQWLVIRIVETQDVSG